MMKNITKWLAAAALLFSIGGAANAQELTLPDRGTTEWSISGDIDFDEDSAWQMSGLWAPFTSRNLQWGVEATLLDAAGIDISGTVGGLVNWYFRGGEDTSNTLPYVGLGLAAAFGDLEGSVWNIHGGIKHFLSSDVAIRAELAWKNYSEDAIDDTVGLSFGISVFR